MNLLDVDDPEYIALSLYYGVAATVVYLVLYFVLNRYKIDYFTKNTSKDGSYQIRTHRLIFVSLLITFIGSVLYHYRKQIRKQLSKQQYNEASMHRSGCGCSM